jgi:uncharacterized PurR-regulated membrane protein YhhQ (DUF165 family)
MKRIGIITAIGFIATVWMANYAVERWGIVSVGFGLVAPAGVYFAGLAFTLRDIVQRTLGRYAAALAILIGAALSWFISDRLAVASAVAFLASELLDLVVFTATERRSFTGAVVVSNAVGIVTDSLLFLWIAFGSLEFFRGQVVGKAWMTLAALPVVLLLRGLLVNRQRPLTA